MQKHIKIYIIAGESSGDYLGSTVIKQFLQQNVSVSFYGIGGPLMQTIEKNNKFVFTSLFNIKEIAIMGLIEILFKVFKISRLINKTCKDILLVNPDIILTIDSLGFNKRVIKKIKPFTKAKLVHLVAPTVWAWKPKRVFEIAKLYNKLLCLFEFEKKYFENHIHTEVVGHPIVEIINNNHKNNNTTFLTTYNLSTNHNNILLMPGSRITEVSKLLPIFVAVAKKLNNAYNNLHFIIPTVSHLYEDINNYIKKDSLKNVTIINNVQDKYNAFNIAKFAIVASGTATLELTLYNVNSIVGYKVNWLSGIIANLLIKIKYASIINIMSNKEIIPEFIQEKCTVTNLYNQAVKVIKDNHKIQDNKEVTQILYSFGYNTFVPSQKIVASLLNNN